MRCVHCEKPIRNNQKRFTYPLSKMDAHFNCVSQPSVEETDLLLMADRRSNIRRVYTSRFQTKTLNVSNKPRS